MLALRLDNRAMHGARSDLAALQGGGNGSHESVARSGSKRLTGRHDGGQLVVRDLMGDGMGDGLRCSSHHPVDLWLAAAAAAQRQRAWHV